VTPEPSPTPEATPPTTTPPTEPASLIGDAVAKAEPSKEEPKVEPKAETTPLTIEDFKEIEGFDAADPTLKSYVDLMNDPALTAKDRSIKLIELQKQVMKDLSDKSTQAFVKLNQEWEEQVRSDPEFANGKLEPALGGIAKLVTRFGDEKTKEAFDYTGAGNHPAIVKFLHKVSQVLNEPGPDPVKIQPSTPARTRAQILFGDN